MTTRPTLSPSSRSRRAALPAVLLALALAAVAAVRSPAAEPPKPAASAPASPAAAPAEPTAEQKFKNIKVLTGMPASQMFPVMHLMRASLGVQCDFCHVTEGGRFDLDTKMEKETAREMIRLVFSVNKDFFEGQTRVTCNTCHRGQEHPVRVPPLGQGLATASSHGHEPEAAGEKLPSAAEVLDRYIQALGGRAALEAVHSRVSRGTILRMKVEDPDTPKARVVNRGQEDPFEMVQELPDRITITIGGPPQPMVQHVEGGSGTLKGAHNERPLQPQEAARLAEANGLRKDLDLRSRADKARVTGQEPIDGKDAIVLRLPGENGVSQTLYFDAATGLLRRQITNRPTVLGPDPEQVDYDDYRDVGGVKVPFLVKTSYIDDDRLGTTRKLTEVKDSKGGGEKR